MVDDVKDITETADAKAASEALDRARLARERREAEQRKRLDELRAHAAAAQAQREKRDEDRRRRQAEQRARDDDRRQQVEERKRAIWEASISRRETLLQREKERTERLEKQRASKSSPRPAYAFGSSTPRLLEPVDSGGFFWAARRAASTTNVMFASAPLTRRASALQLDSSDNDNKAMVGLRMCTSFYEPDRQQAAIPWSSVARRRTDLVPTIPASRAPGRAYSMTRLDRIPNRISYNSPSLDRITNRYSPSMDRINKCSPSTDRINKLASPAKQHRSGESTPTGSRPGSAMSNSTVVRRVAAVRRPRPASIAGTGVNTPRGTNESQSIATTPSVSRDPSTHAVAARRPRPLSVHTPSTPLTPGEGKPPVHRKPKPSKEHDKTPRNKSLSASPGRALSPSPVVVVEQTVDKDIPKQAPPSVDKSQVCPKEVTEKLEALQIQHEDIQVNDVTAIKEVTEPKPEVKPEVQTNEVKPQAKPSEEKLENKEEKKEEKIEDNEMTASMISRKITTEEEAKAALAERRRRAREELERHARLERERLQQEAEEEAERQRLERERERKEEEEARELAALQRRMEEEKLRKAIEAQQQLERDESERKIREEAERQSRLQEEEEKRRQAIEAERLRKIEAEKEEKERNARRQRVEAIMARTRRKKQEEDEKKAQESKAAEIGAGDAPVNNGNVSTGDLLGISASQAEHTNPAITQSAEQNDVASEPHRESSTNNGNGADLLMGLSESNHTEDKIEEQFTKPIQHQADPTPILETNVNNGNVQHSEPNVGHISANFIQTERMTSEIQTKIPEKMIEEDFTSHNGHGTTLNHPLTLQNAI